MTNKRTGKGKGKGNCNGKSNGNGKSSGNGIVQDDGRRGFRMTGGEGSG